jgi:hypothetical protein
LGDYIRRLQEVNQQPNQSYVACVPDQSSYADAECGSSGGDNNANNINADYRNNAEQPSAFIKCPDSGKLCTRIDFPNDCKGDPTAQGQSTLSSGSSAVSGAICEARTTAGECISRSEYSAGDTEQHTDAGHNNDGPAETTRL